jgi:hypothetical protein
MGDDRKKQNMIKSIHSPSVFIGAIIATVLFSLGLSFPISFESIIGFWSAGFLIALTIFDYSRSFKRLQVK